MAYAFISNLERIGLSYEENPASMDCIPEEPRREIEKLQGENKSKQKTDMKATTFAFIKDGILVGTYASKTGSLPENFNCVFAFCKFQVACILKETSVIFDKFVIASDCKTNKERNRDVGSSYKEINNCLFSDELKNELKAKDSDEAEDHLLHMHSDAFLYVLQADIDKNKMPSCFSPNLYSFILESSSFFVQFMKKLRREKTEFKSLSREEKQVVSVLATNADKWLLDYVQDFYENRKDKKNSLDIEAKNVLSFVVTRTLFHWRKVSDFSAMTTQEKKAFDCIKKCGILQFES
jgi:hypothetical protein